MPFMSLSLATTGTEQRFELPARSAGAALAGGTSCPPHSHALGHHLKSVPLLH